jgi:hypothetical protein
MKRRDPGVLAGQGVAGGSRGRADLIGEDEELEW